MLICPLFFTGERTGQRPASFESRWCCRWCDNKCHPRGAVVFGSKAESTANKFRSPYRCDQRVHLSLDTGSLEACSVFRLGQSVQGTTVSPQLHSLATLLAFPASTTHSGDIPPFERKSQHTTTSRPGGLYWLTVVSPSSILTERGFAIEYSESRTGQCFGGQCAPTTTLKVC